MSWVALVRQDQGIARLYLDGVLDATVDLYSPTAQYQQNVYSRTGLPLGVHTLKIEVTGTKNPSSTAALVSLDAIEVEYASFQARTELNPLSSFPKDSEAWGVIQPFVIDFGAPFDGYRFWCYYNPYPPETSEVVWLVRSNDGVSWTDAGISNPVFPAPAGFNDAAHPAVFKDGTTWYLYADGRDLSDDEFKIFYATASDPKGPWTFRGVVVSPTASWERNSVGSARVMKDGSVWKMWYDNADPSGSVVGYATASGPGGPWTKYSGNPIFGFGAAGQWDDWSVHHIDIIKDGPQFIMLYTGQGGDGRNALGIASSYDGLTWSREKSNPVISAGNEPWSDATLYQGTIRRIDGNLKIWFTGAPTTYLDGAQIGLAEDTSTIEANSPPSIPATPNGPSSGVVSVSYAYSTASSDPEGHQILYTFDWGDGTTTVTALAASGTSVSASHSWSAAGTYGVRVMATDALGVSSGWSPSLAVVITTGTTTTRYEQTSSAIAYAGTWSNNSNSGASSGSFRSSTDSTTPASATFTFTGIGVSWISDVGSNLGIASVYLDGVLDATVDLYNSTRRWQQTVYSRTGLILGAHTLRIVVTGTKNPSSSARRIDVDAFDVVNNIAPAITTTVLPNGRAGVSYSATLNATGGTPPYGWQVLSGTFPSGLSLGASSGTISGIPSASGNFSFTVRVTDSAGRTAD
ncbi:MAG TPA: putative Ig domain-containing protein, partial [Methylomirabilota bacterium]|nr:putative Ig domain-containing protein [Methylomirabilota bacterium]